MLTRNLPSLKIKSISITIAEGFRNSVTRLSSSIHRNWRLWGYRSKPENALRRSMLASAHIVPTMALDWGIEQNVTLKTTV